MKTGCRQTESWCPVPWVGASTNPSGQYRLCVQANSDKTTRGLFWDQKKQALSGKSHSLAEGRNGELAKEVRRRMLNGEKHPACVRCHTDEENGLTSKRQWAVEMYTRQRPSISFHQCENLTAPNGSIEPEDFPIKEIDLRLGNRCNFSCRSCYPGESSGWYKEWLETKSKSFNSGERRIELENLNGKIKAKGEALDWVNGSRLIQCFASDTQELERLAIVGGEPLLIDEHFATLQSLIDQGRSGKIELDYNSNVSVVPQKVLELWSHFKKVRVGYSIDGVGAVNDYIRYPSKWSRLEENIHKLDRSDLSLEMWPAVTVMAYNVFDIPNVISWQIQSQFKKQNLDASSLFMVQHPLRFPEALSTQILPFQAKEKVAQDYIRYQEDILPTLVKEFAPEKDQDLWRNRVEILFSSIVNFMLAEDKSHLLPKFKEDTQRMDSYRKQDFKTSLPQLAAWI